MTKIDIPASDVRIPVAAKHALASHHVVEVTSHGVPSIVMLHPADFATVRPILERRGMGLPVPIDDLLDEDDFGLLNDLREDDGGDMVGITPAWS